MKKEKGIIYDSKEGLINQAFRFQRLEEEGISTGSLREENWKKLIQSIEADDRRKLGQLRQELKEL